MIVFAMLLIFTVGGYQKGKQDQAIQDHHVIEFYKEQAKKPKPREIGCEQ